MVNGSREIFFISIIKYKWEKIHVNPMFEVGFQPTLWFKNTNKMENRESII